VLMTLLQELRRQLLLRRQKHLIRVTPH
jgi:hypothetical protein